MPDSFTTIAKVENLIHTERDTIVAFDSDSLKAPAVERHSNFLTECLTMMPFCQTR